MIYSERYDIHLIDAVIVFILTPARSGKSANEKSGIQLRIPLFTIYN